tara:strand:+ start:109 stop:1560 length:1452 start_codon:yes stop_codon:yes gene_type:complete
MNFLKYLKYGIRFLFLQVTLTLFTSYYFDTFLLPQGALRNEYRLQIDANLVEDKNRFLGFISDDLVRIDIVLAIFIFVFLVFLFATKFYTYVNELSFSLDNNYLGEYFSIFLVWTTSVMIFVTMFRFSNLISRGYLLLYIFIVPLFLLLFRNSEIVSSIFGRSVTNEKYITINLEEDSIFRKLRIMTFRNNIGDFSQINLDVKDQLINLVDSINKEKEVNLIVINLDHLKTLSQEVEKYLINLNKKILLISKNKITFSMYFLHREDNISNFYLTYFNNDIQYGSKYILKRLMDIIFSIVFVVIFSPIYLFIAIYIFLLDRTPIIIKQNRVGLHGKHFQMYKFRSMYKDSHDLRKDLQDKNTHSGPLFKLENDPRIIKGTEKLRMYSLDELPQFFNVLKGQMSLVGPRPLFEEDTKLFEKDYMRRLNVLPGITGLLQINERNTSEFSVWFKYDLTYIENWSLLLDLQIILKTPISIFKSKIIGK